MILFKILTYHFKFALLEEELPTLRVDGAVIRECRSRMELAAHIGLEQHRLARSRRSSGSGNRQRLLKLTSTPVRTHTRVSEYFTDYIREMLPRPTLHCSTVEIYTYEV